MKNKVILIGNVGKDPETNEAKTLTSFSLATSEKIKGETVTEWHNLKAFGKTAELIQSYVKKGSQIYIEGKIKTNKWEDKNGQKRSTVEIIVSEVTFLGGKKEEELPY
jgi:single-strand DNA-binding protein